MELDGILELYDRHERREAEAPGFRLARDGQVTRQVASGGQFRILVWSDLATPGVDADAVIAREAELAAASSAETEWKLYSHDRPADLASRLEAAGFIPGGEESVMVIELDALPERPATRSGLEVRKVAGAAGLSDMVAVHAEVWDEDFSPFAAELAAQLRDDPAFVSIYVVYDGVKPVASCRANFPPRSPFASLWGGSTLEEYRGRGIYSELLDLRLREAKARGYRFMTIDAGPMSRPIVERRGFTRLATTWPFAYRRP
jgi:GNAT superfamily N-acetyltransferase